ncbi:glycosyltransferase family A protein [Chitinimonas koreensis]|uniref:glycosyltransferase family A protein n=1 Tax=Chitinimonas koreensis TaxID=356302 RepID=UPI0003FE3AB6|nr:glycosyltransferase family A protein [Chitinimonas koreensis]
MTTPHIAVLALDDASAADQARFLAALYAAEALARCRITVLAAAGGPAAALARPAWVELSAVAGLAELPAALARLHAAAPLAAVHACGPAEHRAAVALKQASATPLFVLRNRFAAETLPQDRAAIRLHNKQTAINLFFDGATFDAMRGGAPGLRLDNPYLLAQPELGEQGPALMLEHCYLSLLSPDRDHRVSGHKRDHSHLGLAFVTHFYCNQKSTDSVMAMLARYARMRPDILDRVHFVVVDDGSPVEYEIPDFGLNLTWLKVDRDIRWNQGGARNLGVTYARADKVVLTDLDHEFPEETFERLLARRPCGKRLYRFWRQDGQGGWQKGHPNIFFLSRARFMEHFGYDEEFAGHYGAEDIRFVKYQKAMGTLHYHLPRRYWCYERQDIDRGRAYHSLGRDLSFNTPVDSRKRQELDEYGHGAGHSRSFLGFSWTTLREDWRTVERPRRPDQRWKWRQLLRQLMPRGW